jgi:hypothetical protein
MISDFERKIRRLIERASAGDEGIAALTDMKSSNALEPEAWVRFTALGALATPGPLRSR